MNDHRISPRRRMLKTGQIAFSDKVPKLECTVRNLSETGACLQISTTVGMPASFALFVDGVRHSCQVVWRTETRLGVAFT
jgi:PilZ domain